MVEDHELVGFAQLFEAFHGLTYKLGVLGAFVEELSGSELKVIADSKKLVQRRQSLARGDVIDIPPAVPEIIAHLILRDALFESQLCYAVAYKFLIHTDHLIYIIQQPEWSVINISLLKRLKSPRIYVIIKFIRQKEI